MAHDTQFRFPSARVFSSGRLRLPHLSFGIAAAIAVAVLPLPGIAQQPQHIAATPPLSPAQQQKKFHLPPGFAIELVDAEPQVRKPMNLSFDSAGRLLVTTSTEYPFAAKPGRGRDLLKRLTDRDGDGRFETVETVGDRLNIPIGVAAVGKDALVFSIPHIYRLSDGDGDGRLERREKTLGPFGHDDTHGLNNAFTRWIDGWIYACHGFRNTSRVTGADGNAVSMNSGNTYRFRPDGSRVEHFTHGQVNPFGLCFDPFGNLYSADCHSKPAYMLLRGAYYPSFGKPHDGLGFGPTLIEHNHGSTAIAGIVYYAATQFPEKYRGTVFVGNVVTNRINHDRLAAHGSTYRGHALPDFLRCDDPWFRPVDIKLGPDGALYVADFYNRIIGHYEVPLNHPQRDRERGRIWRIVYRGERSADSPVPGPPDLTKDSLPQLWARLASGNLTLRTLATNEIIDRFEKQAPTFASRQMDSTEATATQIAHGLWIVERTVGLSPRQIAAFAKHEERLVRVHLVRALAERKNWPAPAAGKETVDVADLVRSMLKDPDPFVRRVAADALGRRPAAANMAPLLAAWRAAESRDAALIHTARMALRDQLKSPGIYDALGRMELSTADRRRLLDITLAVKTPAAAEFAWRAVLEEIESPPLEKLAAHAVEHFAKARLQPALSELSAHERLAGRPGILKAVHNGLTRRGARLPATVRKRALAVAREQLRAGGQVGLRRAIAIAGQLRLTELLADLSRVAADNKQPASLRSAALEACAACDAGKSAGLLARVLRSPQTPRPLRLQAARLLGAAGSPTCRKASREALAVLDRQLATELALSLATSREGGELLLEEVAAGRASRRLLTDAAIAQRLRAARIANLKPRLEQLTAGLPPADKRLALLMQARREGFAKARPNATAGRALFQKHCAACHRVGDSGNKVGPELHGIGARGASRLIEDLLDPSRNVDPAFRSTILVTAEGAALTGLVQPADGNVLVIFDSQGKSHRVPADEVESRRTSPLSPMPANVDRLMSEKEFYDLLAFLLEQRAAQ